MNSSIKAAYGPCVECNDGQIKRYGNKAKRLCVFHNTHRLAVQRLNRLTGVKVQRKPIKKISNSDSAKERRNNDSEFYYQALTKARQHPYCEECNRYIPPEQMNRGNISHIITKGADTALRNHPLNWNLLCAEHHTQWEGGDRKSMKIYKKNQERIKQMRNDK